MGKVEYTRGVNILIVYINEKMGKHRWMDQIWHPPVANIGTKKKSRGDPSELGFAHWVEEKTEKGLYGTGKNVTKINAHEIYGKDRSDEKAGQVR